MSEEDTYRCGRSKLSPVDIELRGPLSIPSNREERLLVRVQLSAPCKNADRHAAWNMCNFVVCEIACWRTAVCKGPASYLMQGRVFDRFAVSSYRCLLRSRRLLCDCMRVSKEFEDKYVFGRNTQNA